jgi:protease secretion system membrane fusion protein
MAMVNPQNAELVTDKTPDTERSATDSVSAAKKGLIFLALSLGIFVAWAAFAPLDEGVPTPALVALDTKRKSVQNPNNGIVQAIHVREGQDVKEGDVLFEFDAKMASANHETISQRYLNLRAVQARLLAESTGAAVLSFHPDLKAAAKDPLVAGQMEMQSSLWRARRAALASELQAADEAILGQRATIEAMRSIKGARTTQLQLVRQELEQMRPLAAEGYLPKNRIMELERSVAELQASLADVSGQSLRAERSIAEIEQRKITRMQESRKEVAGQLSEVSKEVESDAARLVSVEADLDRVKVRATATGQAVGVTVQTVGAVVQAGQKLLDIVPKGEPLLIEAHVATHLIDKVKTGLKADVRFATFSHEPQLVIEGQVASVSKDFLVDQANSPPYYLARIVLTEEGKKTLGKRQMQPGMPAEVVIKTGERSLLTYLLSPLTKRVAASMKEE